MLTNQYRITYWEAGQQYQMIIGTTNLHDLKQQLKKRFNRFKIEAR